MRAALLRLVRALPETSRGEQLMVTLLEDAADEPTPNSIDSDRLKASLFAKLFDEELKTVSVGRYRVLDEIGAGGMGRVYSAYDEELDRKVAIKVVHGELSSDSAKSRLRREAQALGRLTHPNVVTVHEIGEHNGQIFVAMEFVRGQTLRGWREAKTRTVPQILAVYLQAAQGLDAAHQAGVLHRDFKPDNALVGDDGRVRVVDFGLARGLADPQAQRVPATPAPDEGLDTPLTKTGSVLGTPAYMAPEQFVGDATDAYTDQFALCVALWEALYGSRPFAGSSFAELSANVTAGEHRAFPRDVSVSSRVRSLLETGLTADPAGRHPDMATVVAILEHELSPQKARWWIPATAVPVAALALFALAPDREAKPLEKCAPAVERLAGVWDDDVRERLAAKFQAEPARPYVATSWDALQRAMDDVVAQWTASYEGACAAVGSPEAAPRRMAVQRLDCLDAVLPRLAVIVESADSLPAVDYATTFAGYIGTPTELGCDNDAYVRRLPPTPTDPDALERLAEVRMAIARAGSVSVQGKPKEAIALAERAVEAARAMAYPPVLAEALTMSGEITRAIDESRGDEIYTEAIRVAESAGHDLALAASLIARVSTAEDPEPVIDRTRAVIARLGSPVEFEVFLLNARVASLLRGQRFDEALALARETAQRYGADEELPPFLRRQVYLTQMSVEQTPVGDTAEMLAAARRTVTLVEAEIGEGHPRAADALDHAAFASLAMGHYEESVAAYTELEARLREAYPEGHPRLGWVMSQRARGLDYLGRAAQAKKAYVDSETMLVDLLGPTHRDVLRGPTFALANRAFLEGDTEALRSRLGRLRGSEFDGPAVSLLGAALDGMDGKTDSARATMVELLPVLEAGAPGNAQAARLIAAWVELVAGDVKAARLFAEPTVEGPRLPGSEAGVAPAMVGYIRVLDGDFQAALPLLEEALMHTGAPTSPDGAWYSVIVHYGLAVALMETAGDRQRALKLARIAAAANESGHLPKMEIAAKAAKLVAALEG